MELHEINERCTKIKNNIETVIVGKGNVIDLILTSLIAGGHVLLEDVPGTGKTMMAKALAKSISTNFSRIQFTPDLLPSDITGLNFYNQKAGEFTFRSGPVFTNILLADEINRATPRTQSALLECMEEKQITIDGETRPLNRPFFVIATQNPVETSGTFPLPEAQLDRFMMQLSMGHPNYEEEIKILNRYIHTSPIAQLSSVCSKDDLTQMQDIITNIYVHPSVMGYLVKLTEATRVHSEISLGVSTRGSLAFLRACQSYAAVTGMKYVTPDIVKYLAPFVLAHRLVLRTTFEKTNSANQIIHDILEQVEVPTENFAQ